MQAALRWSFRPTRQRLSAKKAGCADEPVGAQACLTGDQFEAGSTSYNCGRNLATRG